jgi:hypothetical protein
VRLYDVPANRRRRASVGGVGAIVYIVVATTVLVVAPWGQATWIVLFGSVAVALLALTMMLVVGLRRGP